MQSGVTLLREILSAAAGEAGMSVWWLGQHGFVIRQGSVLLWLDPFLTPMESRRVPPLLSPEDIPSGSIIFGSHDHADHIDRPAWRCIADRGTDVTFVVPEIHRESILADTGLHEERLIGLDDMVQKRVGAVLVTGIAAAHEFLERDRATGMHPFLGFVVETGGVVFYHSGDTCIYDGLQAKLRKWRYDAVFLPINGRDARRLRSGCIGNMTYQEAADLAGSLGASVTVPGHFDMFEGNREDPELFADYMAVKYPARRVVVPDYGRRIDI